MKSKNLAVLADHGIPTPRGFTVPAEFFQNAVLPLATRISSAVANKGNIAELFQSGYTGLIEEHINRSIGDLEDVGLFAVRSCGAAWSTAGIVGEDGDIISLAGQFDSYLNVPRTLLPQAVLRCWASMFNTRSIARFGGSDEFISKSLMRVIIQEMIPAKASAVVMTVDPHGKGDTGAIEFCWGACEGLVSGKVSPDEAIVSRDDCRLVSKSLGSKACVITHSLFNNSRDNSLTVPVAVEKAAQFSLSDSELHNLFETSMEIERLFRKPQDVEAVFSHSGRLVITQARAVTTLPN